MARPHFQRSRRMCGHVRKIGHQPAPPMPGPARPQRTGAGRQPGSPSGQTDHRDPFGIAACAGADGHYRPWTAARLTPRADHLSLLASGDVSLRLFAVSRFLARELPVGGAERPRRAGLACPAPCHSGPDNHRPSLLYLRGTRQPDTALPHPRGTPVFQANARGNVSGGQGRWVTGSRK